MLKGYKSLLCRNTKFSLKLNLTCGQSFRWRCLDEDTLIGVFSHRVWLLRQQNHQIQYKVLACLHWSIISDNDKETSKRKKKSDSSLQSFISTLQYVNGTTRNCHCEKFEESLIKDYLQSDFNWNELLLQWSDRDRKFLKPEVKSHGIHVLRQNPFETLISFLCSVNNAIYRIVPMIEKMCNTYGKKLFECHDVVLHDFPDIEILANPETVQGLRELSFGYRADFIVKCAKEVLGKGGEVWVTNLRNETYEAAHEKLIILPGVGRKVADCVCLMALDKPEAVPIDTHIRQIASREYNHHIQTKSLTPHGYNQLGGFFRSLWGSHAGWAQAELFVNEIKQTPEIYNFHPHEISKKKRQ